LIDPEKPSVQFLKRFPLKHLVFKYSPSVKTGYSLFSQVVYVDFPKEKVSDWSKAMSLNDIKRWSSTEKKTMRINCDKFY